MQSDILASLRRMPDVELVGRVKDLTRQERGFAALLVAHLAELDTRDVHLRAGHGSLFAYCRDELALSEQEAYNRICVARTARRFPAVLDLLEEGALNLTAVRLLGPHLTQENHRSVLESARDKTRAQVEEIAAALWPRPDAPSFVRKLPPPRLARPGAWSTPLPEATGPSRVTVTGGTAAIGGTVANGGAAANDGAMTTSEAAASDDAASDPPANLVGSSQGASAGPLPAAEAHVSAAPGSQPYPVPPGRRSGEVTPLAPDRYKVQVTIGSATLEKLRLAQDLLRHAVPTGDEAAILDRALTALLDDLARRKFGLTDAPRHSEPAAAGSRHIPAGVRREVWLRDLGRCAFVGPSGRRCEDRGFLEFHHVTPFALGGRTSVDNLQMRCRSHNAYEARAYFGDRAGPRHAVGSVGSVGSASSADSAGNRWPASATRSETSTGMAHPGGPAP